MSYFIESLHLPIPSTYMNWTRKGIIWKFMTWSFEETSKYFSKIVSTFLIWVTIKQRLLQTIKIVLYLYHFLVIFWHCPVFFMCKYKEGRHVILYAKFVNWISRKITNWTKQKRGTWNVTQGQFLGRVPIAHLSSFEIKTKNVFVTIATSPVGWSCGIRWLNFCRSLEPITMPWISH